MSSAKREMHDLLELMYCCAVMSPTPQTHDWFKHVQTMCDAIVPCHPDLVLFDDPLVTVSVFHSMFEPSSYDMNSIIQKFMSVDSDVSTSYWGPVAWRLLHALAKDRFELTLTLLTSWTMILPCAQCRHHLQSFLKEEPAVFTTSDDAHGYTIKLHDSVNSKS